MREEADYFFSSLFALRKQVNKKYIIKDDYINLISGNYFCSMIARAEKHKGGPQAR